MKYRLLTKEQFEELHEEFATFLASQQIDANEWKEIKKNKPELAQQELEVFSDFVWDRVLGKAESTELATGCSNSGQVLFQAQRWLPQCRQNRR